MLPDNLNIPNLREPYSSAFSACLEQLFSSYDIVGLLVTGTVVRGGGDVRSDLDIHVLHSERFRERVQLRFNGVPCEIFVNPPDRVHGYFEEDRKDRRPISPHMYATGVNVFDPFGTVEGLIADAMKILADVPNAPSEASSTAMRYSAATEFEDVDDLAERDPAGAALLLGGAARKLAECRVALEPGWLPRAKDLLTRLQEVDPEAAALAEQAVSDAPFATRMAAARELCVKVSGHDGFFEWTSPRESIP